SVATVRAKLPGTMRDILRLARYLRPYKGRILLAILASFLATACLAAFLALVKPIITETFKPHRPAPSSVVAGDRLSREEGPRELDPGGAGGVDLIPSGAAMRSLRERAEDLLGLTRLVSWLEESPFARVPPVVVLIFLLKGICTYFAEYWLKWVGYR